jgi:hypothetical protein
MYMYIGDNGASQFRIGASQKYICGMKINIIFAYTGERVVTFWSNATSLGIEFTKILKSQKIWEKEGKNVSKMTHVDIIRHWAKKNIHRTTYDDITGHILFGRADQ